MADTYQSTAWGHEAVSGVGGLASVATDLAAATATANATTVATLSTALVGLFGGALTPTGAVFLSVDTTVVPTASVLRNALSVMVNNLVAGGLKP